MNEKFKGRREWLEDFIVAAMLAMFIAANINIYYLKYISVAVIIVVGTICELAFIERKVKGLEREEREEFRSCERLLIGVILVVVNRLTCDIIYSSNSIEGLVLSIGLMVGESFVINKTLVQYYMNIGVGYEVLLVLVGYIGFLGNSGIDELEKLLELLTAYKMLVDTVGIHIKHREIFKVWSKEEILAYKKLGSLYSVMNRGLNVHEFIPCRNEDEIVYAYNKLGKLCSIRTDKLGSEQGSLLKFYMAENLSDFKIRKIAREIEKDKCIAIISNGRASDKYLRYNMVYKLSSNGDFIAEYSRRNTSLRQMYNFPSELNTVVGNIDSNIRDWEVRVSKEEAGRVDLREIKELLRNEYEHKLFDRYVEISEYSKEVGVRKETRVYWEV